MSETSAIGPAIHPELPMKRKLSSGTLAIGVLAILLLTLVAGSIWLYSGEERSLAESREGSATLSAQLAQSQQETQASQTDLEGVRQQLTLSQTETTAARAAGKSLADQLAQSQQQAQQAEVTVTDLHVANDDLTARLAQSESES